VAVLAALAAALSYALASVLQHWEAEKQPADKALRLSLVARLARRPRWVAGLGFDVGGYALQWWALTVGSLVLVQPLLVLGLLFALPIKARFTAYRFHGWDWAGALLTTGGLAVFLVASRPAAGHPNVDAVTWTILLCATAVLAGGLVAIGHRSSPRWKAVAYGSAGGIVYGLCAALTKTCAHLLSLGVSQLFESWQPYVLAAAGVAGMVLAQSAFQAGPLDASLPTLSATDPIVSVLIGAVAFGEAIRIGVAETTLEVLSFSAVVAGIFVLAHTEAVNAAQRHHFAEVDACPQEPIEPVEAGQVTAGTK
jgi:drug/metabolite transporter (DMT)-like permease